MEKNNLQLQVRGCKTESVKQGAPCPGICFMHAASTDVQAAVICTIYPPVCWGRACVCSSSQLQLAAPRHSHVNSFTAQICGALQSRGRDIPVKGDSVI